MKKLTCLLVTVVAQLQVSQGQPESESNDAGVVLEIQREERSVNLDSRDDAFPRRWIKRGENRFEVRYVVPPAFLQHYDEEGNPNLKTAEDVLGDVGIQFQEGASAVYDRERSELVVIQGREEIETLEAYLGVHGCLLGTIPRAVAVSVEIFEIPFEQVQELVESAAAEGDNTPERNALVKFVRDGGGRLVAAPTIRSSSGRRATVKDVSEVLVPMEIYLSDSDGDEKGLLLETREVGTLLTVESYLSNDTHSIGMSLELEHHTAPPSLQVATDSTKLPVFHAKSIETDVQMRSGNSILIGSWKPTGKPEYEKGELGHVIFVTATVQNAGGYGQKEPAVRAARDDECR